MTLKNYEKVWLKINEIHSNQVSQFLKREAYFMKNIDICYFIAELDFITENTINNEVVMSLPELDYNFVPCENTVFATKNDDFNSISRIKLYPQKLVLTGFPFSSNTKYEFNIQLFMRVV